MGQTVTFASDGGTCEGYLAVPDGGAARGPFPGVVVVQEWWGLVPHIRDVVDRFAAAGFVALAPDHFRGVRTTEPDEAQKLMMGVNIAQVARDLSGAAAYLAGHDEVAGDRVGSVGFCMGGGLSLLGPTVADGLVAAVGFYPATPWPDYSPDWTRYAGRAALVHAAEGDGGSAAPHVRAVVDAVRAAGGEATVYDYPGSQHAFFNDDRPEVYSAEHAAVAWERTLAFLREHLPS